MSTNSYGTSLAEERAALPDAESFAEALDWVSGAANQEINHDS